MGGRGSCYLNFHNASASSGADLFMDLGNIDEDKDTQKPYDGTTKKLIDAKIHIKESTDKINEDIFVPNVNKFKALANKYTNATAPLKEGDEQLRIRAAKMPSQVQAAFSTNAAEMKNLQIAFNKDLSLATKESLEISVQKQIDSKFWTSSDKEELINHTPTHEFGHFVQRMLMENERNTPEGQERFDKFFNNYCKTSSAKKKQLLAQEYSESYATKYFKQIQKIHRKKFGKENLEDISRYGQTNNRECFAELFANANTAKEPTNLSKSLDIFLKERNISND